MDEDGLSSVDVTTASVNLKIEIVKLLPAFIEEFRAEMAKRNALLRSAESCLEQLSNMELDLPGGSPVDNDDMEGL